MARLRGTHPLQHLYRTYEGKDADVGKTEKQIIEAIIAAERKLGQLEG